MWQKFKNYLFYITRSSTDPNAMSLTFKGVLVGILPLALTIAGLTCTLAIVCVDTSQFSPLVDALVGFSKALLEAVSYALIIVGIMRKIWLGRLVHPLAKDIID